MDAGPSSSTGPLDGVRVIELAGLGPVPFLGMLLSDLGADVVRIDRIPGAGGGLASELESPALSRGRTSIALDLHRPEAVEVALRLVAGADVLLEGFRPGVTERLGVGPAHALARNPQLVYGRMTGWGQDGPLAGRAGHDITYLAVSGVLHGIGPAALPTPPVNYLGDYGGGSLILGIGVLAALLHARASGRGQVVDAAMTEGAAYLASVTRALTPAGGWRDARAVNMLDGGAPNYRCYECADGKFVAVGALEPQFWAALLTGLGRDPATMPSPYDRAQWDRCRDELTAVFATRGRDEWAALFDASDACVAPVLSLAEAPAHPQNLARSAFGEVGGVSMPQPVPRFSDTPARLGEPTVVGAGAVALLAELGYGPAQLAELRRCGALG